VVVAELNQSLVGDESMAAMKAMRVGNGGGDGGDGGVVVMVVPWYRSTAGWAMWLFVPILQSLFLLNSMIEREGASLFWIGEGSSAITDIAPECAPSDAVVTGRMMLMALAVGLCGMQVLQASSGASTATTNTHPHTHNQGGCNATISQPADMVAPSSPSLESSVFGGDYKPALETVFKTRDGWVR
jgi:hypothetical protein